MLAGIYCRISQDISGQGLGVARQKKDCIEKEELLGWEVSGFYIDNDTSATSGKPRPEYQRMLRDVKAGVISAVVSWSIDRLTRTPLELELIIALHDKRGLSLANVHGDIDLSTPSGVMMARILGAFARSETDTMALRLKAKFKQKAEAGEPHGYAPYGYRRVIKLDDNGKPIGYVKQDVILEEHGAVVREAAQRILGLESLRSVATDFNKRGIHGPKAESWSPAVLRQILLRPTNAGLRQHRGKIIGPSTTEPLYDEGTHYQLVALLRDPARRSNLTGSAYKYLLGGIAVCGLCGGPMRRQIGRALKDPDTKEVLSRQPPSYNCSVCYKIRRNQAAVDETVVSVIIGRLSMPDAADLFGVVDMDGARRAQAAIDGIEAKELAIAAMFMADEITAAQMKSMNAASTVSRKTAMSQLNTARPLTSLTHLVGGDVRAKWDELPIAAQREMVKLLMTVTILPTGSGKRYDPDLVLTTWLS